MRTPTIPRGRMLFLDVMRGFAALAVAMYHMAKPTVQRGAPDSAFSAVCAQGSLGVYVFFVISGFVIAHVLEGEEVTPTYAAKFVLRRSVRLDPPYWVTIAFSVAASAFTAHMVGATFERPTLLQLFAHLTYTQGLLGFPHLSAGLWTLCLELQFYVLLVIALCAARALPRASWLRVAPWALCAIVVTSAAFFTPTRERGDGTALLDSYVSLVPNVCFFGLGMLVRWGLRDTRSLAAAIAAIAGVALFAAVEFRPALAVSAATAVVVLAAAWRGGLSRWLAFAPLVWLGELSYSLYLVHEPVGLLALRAVRTLIGHAATETFAGLALTLVAGVIAAAALHRFVEVPAQRFARKINPST